MGKFFHKYSKPGPGVRKDQPQKKEFVRFFEIYGRKFWNLMVANLLYVLVSLPIVTKGWADVGLTRITRSYSREKFAFIRQDFFESIKKNWKQGLGIGIVNLIITAVLALDIYIVYTSGKEDFFSVIMFALILLVAVIFILMQFYIPMLIITFKLSTKQIYKNSFLLALAGLKRNAVAFAVIALIYVLFGLLLFNINLYIALTVLVIFYIFVYPAFRSFLIQFCVFPVVKKYIIDPYYEAHPDEDKELRRDLNLEVDDGVGDDEEESIFTDSSVAEEALPAKDIPDVYRRSTRRADDDDDTI